jgi:uncharacterized 2Fe-2S/4Fe-4S cluster protein (DUF4445 family)
MPRDVKGQSGQTLLEAMRLVFPAADAPCGGEGRCGRCRVLVRGDAAPQLLSDITDEESRLLDVERAAAGWRLACRARFIRSGLVLVDQIEDDFFLPQTDAVIGTSSNASTEKGSEYCAAVDIGTTTITCALAEIESGRVVVRTAVANRQRSYGPDVVSRIENAVRNPEYLREMHGLVRSQVGEMLDGLCGEAGGIRIRRTHLCGNPTMLHLWEGASLEGLARMPFQPVFLESRESELRSNGGLYPCRLLPGISAFVGADITAGILACGLQKIRGRPELLVDIGTNGEIVLAAEGGLFATATAAGPAFEGAAISCGLPAVDGAIDGVTWTDGRFQFTTLGKKPPAGICGSGLLDLLACLRRAGILDENGGLDAAPDARGERAFHLPSDPPLRLTQADVRQLQLAKGAIAAGIRVLCRRAGVALADIARLHLAGAFGSSLSAESALEIGLVPHELSGRIHAAGNTALAGTLMTAVDPAALEVCARVASKVRVLDLSREAGFQDAFMEAMRFTINN